jgi:hypothetical protein
VVAEIRLRSGAGLDDVPVGEELDQRQVPQGVFSALSALDQLRNGLGRRPRPDTEASPNPWAASFLRR